MTPKTIQNTIDINAPISAVWDALVNPEKTQVYMFGCKTISDWKVGSDLLWEGAYEGQTMVFVRGKIIEIKAPKKLVYSTFDPNGTIEDIPVNYLNVTYQLRENDGITTLEVSQGDYATVAEGERRYQEGLGDGSGWQPILEAIKTLVEQ